ncbi:MAG: hypothetical protein AB1705_27300, partial [Verrucomicrobiota bacterium]
MAFVIRHCRRPSTLFHLFSPFTAAFANAAKTFPPAEPSPESVSEKYHASFRANSSGAGYKLGKATFHPVSRLVWRAAGAWIGPVCGV